MINEIIIREKCPVCSSISSKSIYNRSFNQEIIKDYMHIAYQGRAELGFLNNVNFEIVKCKKCNLSYQKYVLNEERLTDLYNKWIDPEAAKEWNMNNKNKALNNYTFIFKFAKKYLKRESQDIKVLDFGAGFGDSLILAKDLGFEAYAYEFSVERIRYMKENGIKIIDAFDETKFDLIIANQILEHITFPEETLNLICSKLENNGLIYISVPNCPNFENKLKAANKVKNPEELHKVLLKANVGAFQHINFFSNNNFKRFLRSHGLVPISPIRQVLLKPVNIKSLVRPFYRHLLSTSLFLKRVK